MVLNQKEKPVTGGNETDNAERFVSVFERILVIPTRTLKVK